MRTLILILFSLSVSAQRFIVFTKKQKDSLAVELNVHKRYMDSMHIAINPIYVKNNVYILQDSIFNKPEWKVVEPTFNSKLKSKVVIRELYKGEQDSIKVRDEKEFKDKK